MASFKYQPAKRQGDIVHYSWVLDCCSQKKLIPLQPKLVMYLLCCFILTHLLHTYVTLKHEYIYMYWSSFLANKIFWLTHVLYRFWFLHHWFGLKYSFLWWTVGFVIERTENRLVNCSRIIVCKKVLQNELRKWRPTLTRSASN